MIGHYLSSNNKMCYSIKINNFSPTKQSLKRIINESDWKEKKFQWCVPQNWRVWWLQAPHSSAVFKYENADREAFASGFVCFASSASPSPCMFLSLVSSNSNRAVARCMYGSHVVSPVASSIHQSFSFLPFIYGPKLLRIIIYLFYYCPPDKICPSMF